MLGGSRRVNRLVNRNITQRCRILIASTAALMTFNDYVLDLKKKAVISMKDVTTFGSSFIIGTDTMDNSEFFRLGLHLGHMAGAGDMPGVVLEDAFKLAFKETIEEPFKERVANEMRRFFTEFRAAANDERTNLSLESTTMEYKRLSDVTESAVAKLVKSTQKLSRFAVEEDRSHLALMLKGIIEGERR